MYAENQLKLCTDFRFTGSLVPLTPKLFKGQLYSEGRLKCLSDTYLAIQLHKGKVNDNSDNNVKNERSDCTKTQTKNVRTVK